MASANSVKSKMRSLIAKANAVTGKDDTNLTDGINSLIELSGGSVRNDTLESPSLTLVEDMLYINDKSGLATSFDILVDGEVKVNAPLVEPEPDPDNPETPDNTEELINELLGFWVFKDPPYSSIPQLKSNTSCKVNMDFEMGGVQYASMHLTNFSVDGGVAIQCGTSPYDAYTMITGVGSRYVYAAYKGWYEGFESKTINITRAPYQVVDGYNLYNITKSDIEAILAWFKENAIKRVEVEPEIPEEPTTIESEFLGTWLFKTGIRSSSPDIGSEILAGAPKTTIQMDFTAGDDCFNAISLISGYKTGDGYYLKELRGVLNINNSTNSKLIYSSFEDANNNLKCQWQEGYESRELTITRSPYGVRRYDSKSGWILTDISELEVDKILSWFKKNATKVDRDNEISFFINDTAYRAIDGMTWYEWANSGYNTSVYNCDNLYGNVYDVHSHITIDGSYENRVVGSNEIVSGTNYFVHNAGIGGSA